MRTFKDGVTNRDYYWYEPKEITFRREHLIFLIEHWELLEQGIYPPEPSGDYIEIGTVDVIRPNWKSAGNIHGEILHRLKTTKDAGQTLIWEITHGMTKYERLSPAAKGALNYITGWKRRETSYPNWKAMEKYREKYDEV